MVCDIAFMYVISLFWYAISHAISPYAISPSLICDIAYKWYVISSTCVCDISYMTMVCDITHDIASVPSMISDTHVCDITIYITYVISPTISHAHVCDISYHVYMISPCDITYCFMSIFWRNMSSGCPYMT